MKVYRSLLTRPAEALKGESTISRDHTIAHAFPVAEILDPDTATK
jgi:hypothetical protein